MAYIYNYSVDVDLDIEPKEFWDACNEDDKKELKDLVLDHFHLSDNREYEFERLADGIEAKELVRRTFEELEYKLKMRDFS